MNKLVLLRHGQSQWNLENRFTGWKDVPLTEKGINEANKAGLKNTLNAIEVLGNSEGLDAHVKSAKIRFSKE